MYKVIRENIGDYRTRVTVRNTDKPNDMLAIWYCDSLSEINKAMNEGKEFIKCLG